MKPFLLSLTLTLLVTLYFIHGCFVDERCINDSACGSGNICDHETDTCRPGCRDNTQCPGDLQCFGTVCICLDDNDCGEGRICEEKVCQNGCTPSDCERGTVCFQGRCVVVSSDGDADTDAEADVPDSMDVDGDTTVQCPVDMVQVRDYCIDIYEASRLDADETDAGINGSIATSRRGVVPWTNMTRAQAAEACQAARKRLCTAAEWIIACRGPEDTEYPYGGAYEPETCNGIDTFGRGFQKLMPTGSFSECKNGFGVFDISGNVWEIDHDYPGWVHGGAFNCVDSQKLHQCSYNQDFGPDPRTNVGFRCCSDGL